MKKNYLLLCVMTLLGLVSSRAAVNITGQEGWFESACVTWTPGDGLEYNVYVSEAQQETWTQLDDELLRSYAPITGPTP